MDTALDTTIVVSKEAVDGMQTMQRKLEEIVLENELI